MANEQMIDAMWDSRWNRPWQYSCDRPNALPMAEHFVISIGEILYGYKL